MRNQIKRIVGIGIGTLLIVATAAMAKTVTVKGSGSATYATTAFTYDGLADAVLITGSGKDNFGGAYTFQAVAEWSATSTTCTTAGGNPGLTFNLVQSDGAVTYKTGQVYLTSVGAPASTQCVGAKDFNGALNLNLAGGAGKFVSASGSGTNTFAGATLAAPAGGVDGLFGAETFTQSGSGTK